MIDSGAILKEVKQLKGIPDSDTIQDPQIEALIELTEKALLSHLPKGTEEIPDKFGYVITDIVVKRYNRLGSEGLKKKTLEGLIVEFFDSDFAHYQHLVYEDKGTSDGEGVVMFS